MRVLCVYKYATVGGVERVILNRARAFKEHGLHVKQDVFFFQDSGGLQYFRKFINYFQLEDHIAVVSEIEEKNYDLIFSFDTPEVFEYVRDTSNVIVECHSPYKESRAYLKSIPKNVAKIVSPGEAFMESVIRDEVLSVFGDRLFVLPNFYISNAHTNIPPAKIWAKKPICYVGRMDSLKNTKELLDIFTIMRKKLDDDYFLLLVGDVRPHYMDIKDTIKKLRVEDRVVYFRPIPFEKVDVLFTAVKLHNGIFVSPSRGESFGLSALEAMSNNVPVLLSEIECHKPLINNDPAFRYQPGDIHEAVAKVEYISDNYYDLSVKVSQFAAKHNSAYFIESWRELCAGTKNLLDTCKPF
ncbi:MAG: glycosyltransferase [Defluviitaleaceae bacterium]|nr:glycosyltransferase [Defluviitaleaceae bacterium]